MNNTGRDTDVPKEYLRTPDPNLLPPRVGHNWNDAAFRDKHEVPQQLEGEFRGKRYFMSKGNFENPPPGELGLTANQLLASLHTKNRSRVAKKEEAPYMTLDDKVLRFSAYFRERAPAGGASDFWHRHVTISFYLQDDTISIVEPTIPNSGMDGGSFLKRQKVKADPRQRERFPDDEYLTVNYFNVGEWVRINAVEFFIYDCDHFTREMLTVLGVDVPGPIQPPDDAFTASQKLKSTIKGETITHDYSVEERERTMKFLRDNGKLLRFYGLLDEREGAQGIVRKLELLLYVEDGTVAVVERQNSNEKNPNLFFSRNWLPKSGSLVKVNELTFSHRVNGQKAPDLGPEGHYTEADLFVGMTVNVLGRQVLLYDCDDFTREFYVERYNFEQPPPLDVSSYLQPSAKEQTLVEAKLASRRAIAQSHPPKKNFLEAKNDVLRFRMRLAKPKDDDQAARRFVLSYYTDSEEGAVHEVEIPRLGFPAGCLLKKGPLPKPEEKVTVRQATMMAKHENQQIIQETERYKEADITIGAEIMIAGLWMKVTGMDAHTEARMLGRPAELPSEATIDRLLSALLDFTWSRYQTAVKTFLAMDTDRDGVVGIDEFTKAVKQFQITDDPIVAHMLFERIASSPDTAFLTTEDVMKWMGNEKSSGTRRVKAEATLGATSEVQREEMKLRALRQRTLLRLKEHLEARKMHYADMFRLASTMPRAYKGKRAEVLSLTNPDKDAGITPVQLRRCIEEILGSLLTDDEMFCVIEFFFPTLPKEEYLRQKDLEMDAYVTLRDFQNRFNEMTQLTMLPE